jgi:hypothetical protein
MLQKHVYRKEKKRKEKHVIKKNLLQLKHAQKCLDYNI